MTRAYYNEIDPYAADWLRNLILMDEIPVGDVDTRSIEDVTPGDLAGYTQCHFFAGIGVWAHALRRAGWPDIRPVWTGSCPCQPFSAAGKGDGFDDPRHLWPAFNWLIRQRRPGIVLGEQVAGKNVDPWVDLVQADLEAMGYAFGAVAFPAAGIGAPHIRDRTYWVGHTYHTGLERHTGYGGAARRPGAAESRGSARGLAHAHGAVAEQPAGQGAGSRETAGPGPHGEPDGRGALAGECGSAGPTNGRWRSADWLYCRDAKWRPVEPGTFPLAHGAAQRVGRLRAYGNAIVAPQAEEFIKSVMEARP